MQQPIPVLVVEDNRLLREWLEAMLDEQPDLQAVAVADGPDGALLRLRETRPEVVLVDAALGDHGSRRLVETMRTMEPALRVIVMDVLPVPEVVVDFVRAGASGFIARDATAADFLGTVRSVARGAGVLPLSLTATLFSHIARQGSRPAAPEPREAGEMTKREREVCRLVAEGMSNKEIAQRLHVSTNTVKGHVHHILEKLALHSRVQLAAHSLNGGGHRLTPP